jgi:hypothetical protein
MHLFKKIVAITTVLTVFASFSPASAATIEELEQQIATLLAQLSTLQAQLATLKGETPPGVTGCTITSFNRNLSQGMSGDDVKCLQIILNSDPDTQLAASGVGSPGEETMYFGPLTHAAVVKFQEKYAEDVLAPWGITTGTGYVGSTTREKLNELLAGAPPAECDADVDCPAGYVCTAGTCVEEYVPPTGEGLTVSLASDTPASTNVADNANADFTKFTLTAGSEDVSISKIYVTRSGLATNSDVENIKIVDMDGVYQGSIGSLNVDNRAMLTFVPNLVIEGGTTESFYIRAGIVDTTTGGKTVALGIASADDIISDASEVSGAFPVTGNAMTVVQLTIGSATVSELTTTDSQPDIGDTDVTVLEFKVDAGSTEGITVEQITVMESGTAALDDTNNIELYSITDSESLGTTDWSSEGKASWSDLGIIIGKGDNHRFRVKLDIVGGSGLTINADLIDGSDVLMSVKGNTYGFYITPARDSWDGKGTDQNIQSGALNVSRSASTPATGNIAPADDQELVTFDFDASGEEVKISALHLDFDAGASSGSFTYDQLTNIKVYDEDGNIVCGPKDAANVTDGSAFDVDFTDTFIVPVGVHEYTVKAKIASGTTTGDYVEAGIDDPSSDITAKGMTTNESITPTPDSAVEGLRQTVAAASLSATTLSQPAARSIAAGIMDFVWMTASLDASTSGEDVQVTALVIEDTLGDTADEADEIDNAEIWADLTSENSARGDAYETKVSDTEQPDDTGADHETHSFSLSQTITVPAGSFVKIALVADLAAGATADDTHTISIDELSSGAVTATGADTGSSVTVDTSSGAGSGQTMTVSDNGTLTVSVDASSPSAAMLLDEELSAVGIFKLAANNIEDLDLDSIKITDDGANDGVDTYYFYSNSRFDGGSTSDAIASAPGGSTAEVYISDDTVHIPANDHVLITVKALMNNVDGTAVQNSDAFEVTINEGGDIDTTGISSGAAVDSTDTAVDAATHVLYESYPEVALSASSPSGGDLIPSANTLLAVFDVTATGNKDITFDGAAAPDHGDEDDEFYLQLAIVRNDDGTADDDDLTIKDGDGNTLDSITGQDWDGADKTNIKVDFTSKDFVVPAGETKKLYVYGDTADFEDTGDSIQVWLDDGGTGLDWSIDYDDGDYNEVAKIFKGDIFGPSFVKPGS